MKLYTINTCDKFGNIIIIKHSKNKKLAMSYFKAKIKEIGGNYRTDVTDMGNGKLKYGSITNRNLVTFEIL